MVFPFVTIFFFFFTIVFFFPPCFLFISITFLVPWPFALGARRRLLPSALLSRTQGGERRECCGCEPAAPRPREQPEVAGGVQPRWDTSNPVAWLGQKGRNTGMPLSPLLYAAWHGLSPASAALGSPRGLWLLGVFCQWEDGAGGALAPLPVHSPVPGQRSSRGQAMWHPTRQPSLRRGHQPSVPRALGMWCPQCAAQPPAPAHFSVPTT